MPTVAPPGTTLRVYTVTRRAILRSGEIATYTVKQHRTRKFRKKHSDAECAEMERRILAGEKRKDVMAAFEIRTYVGLSKKLADWRARAAGEGAAPAGARPPAEEPHSAPSGGARCRPAAPSAAAPVIAAVRSSGGKAAVIAAARSSGGEARRAGLPDDDPYWAELLG